MLYKDVMCSLIFILDDQASFITFCFGVGVR